MKIITIVGARPQFIKHFPFEKACENRLELKTIHTGQHYDANMSDIFFNQLGMKQPDYMLHIGSGKHGEQTARMMIEIEKTIEEEKPQGVVVYGDTNSTIAGSLVASKLQIPVFHIEAGIRSFNKEMPEEINRILTDHLSDSLFVPSAIAVENLKREGIVENVHSVGDIMKDLIYYTIENDLISEKKYEENYYYVTIHRPYNTDSKERLQYILNSLNDLDEKVIISIHPRTSNLMKVYELEENKYTNIFFISPQSYFDNLSYLYHSKALITDSGGMQKEAYWLERKCVTIRKETEWVETLINGNNILLFEDLSNLNTVIKEGNCNWNNMLYGEGKTSNKIVDIIIRRINS
jgi:UDP-GlcNAc3NAcA epimerase